MLPNQQEPKKNAADTGHDGQIAAYLRCRDVAVAVVDAWNSEEGDIGVKQDRRLRVRSVGVSQDSMQGSRRRFERT